MKNLDKVIVIIFFFFLLGLVIWFSTEWGLIVLVFFTDNVTDALLDRKPKTDKEEQINERDNKEETK